MYEEIGNYSNGCYCELNQECSSQYCDQYECKSVSDLAIDRLGWYCRVDQDCGSSSTLAQVSPSADTTYRDCEDGASLCGKNQEFGGWSVCDHTNNQCSLSCMVGGCYCTEGAQCNSGNCYDFHCQSIATIPTIAITISFLAFIITGLLCAAYHVVRQRSYLVDV